MQSTTTTFSPTTIIPTSTTLKKLSIPYLLHNRSVTSLSSILSRTLSSLSYLNLYNTSISVASPPPPLFCSYNAYYFLNDDNNKNSDDNIDNDFDDDNYIANDSIISNNNNNNNNNILINDRSPTSSLAVYMTRTSIRLLLHRRHRHRSRNRNRNGNGNRNRSRKNKLKKKHSIFDDFDWEVGQYKKTTLDNDDNYYDNDNDKEDDNREQQQQEEDERCWEPGIEITSPPSTTTLYSTSTTLAITCMDIDGKHGRYLIVGSIDGTIRMHDVGLGGSLYHVNCWKSSDNNDNNNDNNNEINDNNNEQQRKQQNNNSIPRSLAMRTFPPVAISQRVSSSSRHYSSTSSSAASSTPPAIIGHSSSVTWIGWHGKNSNTISSSSTSSSSSSSASANVADIFLSADASGRFILWDALRFEAVVDANINGNCNGGNGIGIGMGDDDGNERGGLLGIACAAIHPHHNASSSSSSSSSLLAIGCFSKRNYNSSYMVVHDPNIIKLIDLRCPYSPGSELHGHQQSHPFERGGGGGYNNGSSGSGGSGGGGNGRGRGGVQALDWSPYNPYILASGGMDGSIRVWDVRMAGGTSGGGNGNGSGVGRACLFVCGALDDTNNHNNDDAASAGGAIDDNIDQHSYFSNHNYKKRHLPLSSSKSISIRTASHEGPVSSLKFLPDGNHIVSVGVGGYRGGGKTKTWDVRSGVNGRNVVGGGGGGFGTSGGCYNSGGLQSGGNNNRSSTDLNHHNNNKNIVNSTYPLAISSSIPAHTGSNKNATTVWVGCSNGSLNGFNPYNTHISGWKGGAGLGENLLKDQVNLVGHLGPVTCLTTNTCSGGGGGGGGTVVWSGGQDGTVLAWGRG